ncbi:MAG: hypothetical protein ACXVY3_09280, partial [Gaiellaceae bacterium]
MAAPSAPRTWKALAKPIAASTTSVAARTNRARAIALPGEEVDQEERADDVEVVEPQAEVNGARGQDEQS